LFGIGTGYSALFAGVSVLALGGILVWLFCFKAATDRWLTFALGLVGGGIIGNFYDRVGLGYRPEFPEEIRTNVRDWILFRLEGVPFFDPWPNFNIADSLLVAGAIMLFVHALFFAAPIVEEGSVQE
jgi:signal peptidase II